MNPTTEMIEMIAHQDRNGGNLGWLTGTETAEQVAAEWAAVFGACVDAAEMWILVGAFDPSRVAELVAAGITPESLLTNDSSMLSVSIAPYSWTIYRRALLDPNTETTLAYAHSNRDMSTAAVQAFAGTGEEDR